MNGTSAAWIAPAPALSEHEFEKISRLAQEHFGLHLHESKHSLVAARLGKVLRELGLKSFQSYYDYVKADRSGSALEGLVDHLTTHHTSFFREPRHFEFLQKSIFPQLRSRSRIDIWSAACSTGEEPYSIAMALLEEMPHEAAAKVRIKASDISARVLNKAKEGIYEPDRFQAIPAPLRQRYMSKCPAHGPAALRFTSGVRAMIEFQQVNLLASLPHGYRCSVLFCRNVMIYFDKATQQRLVERLSEHIEEGGFLLVGHSESLSSISHTLEYVTPAVYRKPLHHSNAPNRHGSCPNSR